MKLLYSLVFILSLTLQVAIPYNTCCSTLNTATLIEHRQYEEPCHHHKDHHEEHHKHCHHCCHSHNTLEIPLQYKTTLPLIIFVTESASLSLYGFSISTNHLDTLFRPPKA